MDERRKNITGPLSLISFLFFLLLLFSSRTLALSLASSLAYLPVFFFSSLHSTLSFSVYTYTTGAPPRRRKELYDVGPRATFRGNRWVIPWVTQVPRTRGGKSNRINSSLAYYILFSDSLHYH